MLAAILLALQVSASGSEPVLFHDFKDRRGHVIGIADNHGHIVGRYDHAGNFVVEKPRCRFHYSAALETRALSILQRHLTANGARFYDGAHPFVTVCRTKSTLLYTGDLTPGGYSALDPSPIEITVDNCTHKILATDVLSPYGYSSDPPCG